MPIMSGRFDFSLADESMEKSKEELYKILQDFISGTKTGAKGKLTTIKKDMEKRLTFYPVEKQEVLRQMYKDELEFLDNVLKYSMPSEYITKERVSKLLDKEISDTRENVNTEIEETIEDTSDIGTYESELKKFKPQSIYVQEDIVSRNLEKLFSCKETYMERLDKIIDPDFVDLGDEIVNDNLKLQESKEEFKLLEDEIKPIYDYFHNGAAKFQRNKSNNQDIKDSYNLFTNCMYEALDLLKGIKFNIGILDKDDIALKLKSASDIETIKKLENEMIEVKKSLDECKEYYQKRYEYYERQKENSDEFNIEHLKEKIDLLSDFIYECEKTDIVLQKIEKRKQLLLETDTRKEEVEQVVETLNLDDDFEEPEFAVPFNFPKTMENNQNSDNILNKTEEQTLDNDEYFDSLLNSYDKNEEIEKEKLEEEILNGRNLIQEKVEIKPATQAIKQEEIEGLEQRIIKNAEEIISKPEKVSQTHDGNENFEGNLTKKIAPVSLRVNDMIKTKNIKSKEDIEENLDEIYEEMLSSKKKKGLLKKEKVKPFGDIDEDIFLDIRRVFIKINVYEKFLEDKSVDDFANEMFKDGIPQYIYEKMDENTSKQFLTGILKYTEMCEESTFTKREKETFEKFVLQPYKLKSMKKKSKDFIAQLQEDTFSQEDIAKKISHTEVEKQVRTVNKEK